MYQCSSSAVDLLIIRAQMPANKATHTNKTKLTRINKSATSKVWQCEAPGLCKGAWARCTSSAAQPCPCCSRGLCNWLRDQLPNWLYVTGLLLIFMTVFYHGLPSTGIMLLPGHLCFHFKGVGRGCKNQKEFSIIGNMSTKFSKAWIGWIF